MTAYTTSISSTVAMTTGEEVLCIRSRECTGTAVDTHVAELQNEKLYEDVTYIEVS